MSQSSRHQNHSIAGHWRDRLATAAVLDAGLQDDHVAISRARKLVDRGVSGAVLAVLMLAVLGGLAGASTTAELLRQDGGPVHAAAVLMILVGGPWSFILLRTIILLTLRRRGGPLLGRLVPAGFGWMINRSPGDPDLTAAVASRTASMLATGPARRLAAVGSGAFWCGYASIAILTIWFVTARVALGFGWESSWLPAEVGRSIVEFASAPLTPILGDLTLEPVAGPPTAAADDPEALTARRDWILFLSAGVGVYLLLPILLWTTFQAAWGHLAAARWHPRTRKHLPAPSLDQTERPIAPLLTDAAAPGFRHDSHDLHDSTCPCHRLVRLDRPGAAPSLPSEFSKLEDLGDLDSQESMANALALTTEPGQRTVIIAWLPATPDRGVRRRIKDLREAAGVAPLLLLDGGAALRRRESPSIAATRLADWRILASELGVEIFECDLSNLTETSRSALADRLQGRGSPDSEAKSRDPRTLDESFAVIGRHLSTTPPLPDDETLATCLHEIARIHSARLDQSSGGWRSWRHRLEKLDPSSAADGLKMITTRGLELLPGGLRSHAGWIGIGGILGAAACAAAAVAAPAALVSLPAWAGTGAGIAGILKVWRNTRPKNPPDLEGTGVDEGDQLGEAVLGAATVSVLWWMQGEDESSIATALLKLIAVRDSGGRAPRLENPDAARLWLAEARLAVVDVKGGDS
ncbi:MAG: DUF2868 domain-containing protein [Planctomycetota bacterium]|nr:DUF2868 domain-containing protein [Planctomycetota bacterium]